ncbi:Pantothenate kinase type III, CoaX-like [Clostridiaceae bacterium JG1575]|nr:Pantothenate kinase type III, CoaX-like [Clostridiaceae bacterium JG1575]
MGSILTLDLGNSNLFSVLFHEDGTPLWQNRCISIKKPDATLWREQLQCLRDLLAPHSPETIVLSSVVPPVTTFAQAAIHAVFPEAQAITVHPGLVPDMQIHLAVPKELGADLVATSVAVYEEGLAPAIIADLGSATKITCVDAPFVFLGGALLPGMAFQAQSLHAMIPHLPAIDLKKPSKLLGLTTEGAIQSGIVNGTLCALLEMARRIEMERGVPCRYLLTGGLAHLFQPDDLGPFTHDPLLLSRGLYHLARRSRKA